ncbi:MAG: FAD-dependent oxidoreductase [Burkholderiaceae bacterium]
MATNDSLSVAIIGGGIGGLATAHYLALGGAKVTVFEASNQLGGLGTYFQYQDGFLEKFYHCMLPSDKHLLSLLDDLQLGQDTYWKDSSFGIMSGGQLYALNTPLELLRFSPLPFVDRLRVGFTGLWGSLRSASGLDDVTCEAWLTGLSGKRAFQRFWKPMLQSKFGDRYSAVPALWFWTRFNREKGAKKERKGYLRGGYKRIADTLAKSLMGRGVDIRTNCPVGSLGLGDSATVQLATGEALQFDRIVYSGPIALLPQLTGEDALGQAVAGLGPMPEMQGVINAVMLLKRGFSSHYWVATTDESIPFQGIVESSTLLERSDTAGHHMIYLMNYVHQSDPLFAHSDEQILAAYIDGLKNLFPDFTDDDVVEARVFRSPHVEPVYRIGYLKTQPPVELVDHKVYLTTSAQVYPQVTSWNGSVGLARDAARRILAAA